MRYVQYKREPIANFEQSRGLQIQHKAQACHSIERCPEVGVLVLYKARLILLYLDTSPK